MSPHMDWRAIYSFWFPTDLEDTDLQFQWKMLEWWMQGGANADLPRFAPVVEAAKSGHLNHWLATPHGRLSLIIVLDQFTRGLYAGTPEAYASDRETLRIVEEGFENGHYDALAGLWERFFFFLPLVHAEGPDHLARMHHVIAVSEQVIVEAPAHLKPLWQFSLSQARAHFDVISRFGRFPHRNSVLGRTSTPEEIAYLDRGDFVYNRPLPAS